MRRTQRLQPGWTHGSSGIRGLHADYSEPAFARKADSEELTSRSGCHGRVYRSPLAQNAGEMLKKSLVQIALK